MNEVVCWIFFKNLHRICTDLEKIGVLHRKKILKRAQHNIFLHILRKQCITSSRNLAQNQFMQNFSYFEEFFASAAQKAVFSNQKSKNNPF